MYNNIYIYTYVCIYIYIEREREIYRISYIRTYTWRCVRIYGRPDQDMSQASGWMKSAWEKSKFAAPATARARISGSGIHLGKPPKNQGEMGNIWGNCVENMGKCWMLMMFEQFLNIRKMYKASEKSVGDNNLTSHFPHSEHPFVVYPTLTHNHMIVPFGIQLALLECTSLLR